MDTVKLGACVIVSVSQLVLLSSPIPSGQYSIHTSITNHRGSFTGHTQQTFFAPPSSFA